MLIRKSMMLFACAAVAVAACENKSDTSKTETNPGATTTPPEQPVTITNAPVNTPAPAATAPANPIASASNATEVTQFPEETKITPVEAKVTTIAATIRPAPQSSDKVQVVKQGLGVTEVAKDKDYVLVLFNDPSDTSKQKAGWIHKDSLENYAFEQDLSGKSDKDKAALGTPAPAAAKAAPAAAKLTCNNGEARLETDHAFCARTCKDDGDCKKLNGVCDGNGKVVDVSGKLQSSHYCVTDSAPGATTGSTTNTGTLNNTGTTNTGTMNNTTTGTTHTTSPSNPSNGSKSAPITR